MEWKIKEILKDILHEIEVIEQIKDDPVTTAVFIRRLKDNTLTIKKICEEKEQEDNKMLEDIHIKEHGTSSVDCLICNRNVVK